MATVQSAMEYLNRCPFIFQINIPYIYLDVVQYDEILTEQHYYTTFRFLDCVYYRKTQLSLI
jgi:hypothetical protein